MPVLFSSAAPPSSQPDRHPPLATPPSSVRSSLRRHPRPISPSPSLLHTAPPSLSPSSSSSLRLPVELLSNVLSHLPLETLLALCAHSAFLRSLCASPTLEPWTPVIADLLLLSPLALPSSLAALGALPWLPLKVITFLLVRAPADWVLFEFDLPAGLGDAVWEDVCRRRFLPSWCGPEWKKTNMGWRTLYLRTLSRVSHRARSSCALDEPFTRWIQLDRRGTATVNRLRTPSFQPIDVYQSLTGQQTHHPQPPPSVRPLVRLTDVTILTLGVLDRPSSMFANANAFAFLHPPALVVEVGEARRAEALAEGRTEGGGEGKGKARERAFSEGGGGGEGERRVIWDTSAAARPGPGNAHSTAPAPASSSATTTSASGTGSGNSSGVRRARARSTDRDDASPSPSSPPAPRARAFNIPLSRTLSGGRSSSSASSSSALSPSSPSSSSWRDASSLSLLGSMFRPKPPSRGPSSSAWSTTTAAGDSTTTLWIASAAPPPALLDLSPAPSAGASPRLASGGLPAVGGGAGSGGNTPRRQGSPPTQAPLGPTATTAQSQAPTTTSLTFATPSPVVRIDAPPASRPSSPFSPSPAPPLRRPAPTPTRPLAYAPLTHPTPTEGFRSFPNHTPGGADVRMRPSGRVWADEVRDGDGGGWEGKEWADVEGLKSWVGPLMIVAVLNASPNPPSSPLPARPSSTSANDEDDEPEADLLHALLSPENGSTPAFSSFDALDLWALAPWLKPGYRGPGGGGSGGSGGGGWGGEGKGEGRAVVKDGRVWGGVGFLREEGRGVGY